MKKKVNIEILTDLPIKSHVADKFGRKDFVNAIADIIYSQSTEVNTEGEPVFKNVEENLIIGLYGSWGHGKSSVINLLDENLKEKKLQTVYFNPWMYGSENQLIASLFQTIIKETQLKGDVEKELIILFKKYYSLIQLVSPDIASTGRAILRSFDKQEEFSSAEQIKLKIDEILSGTANPLTIFIDDVDRLSKDEIHMLFKTLRLIASFKHVIYVVALDFDMVAKSIKEKYADGNEDDGKAFLEKIIQIPIRIPEISKLDLQKYASSLIHITTKIDITENNLVKFIIENYFSTPREVIRFVNGFRFTQHYLGELIGETEILILELIRCKIHPLFEIIKIYYRAIQTQSPNDYFEKRIKAFLVNYNHEFLRENGYGNESNNEYSVLNYITKTAFGFDLGFRNFQNLKPIINAQHSHRISLTEHINYFKSNNQKDLKNPDTIITYFEKSAEINQDEVEIDQ